MRIYGLARESGGVHWYRIREPLRGLAGIGHMTSFGEIFDESIAQRHDTILTHNLHGKLQSEAWQLLHEAGQHRLIFDIDDNIWEYPKHTEQGKYWTKERLQEIETNIRLSHLVTTPSEVLATKIRFSLHDNVVVLPNYVPQWVTKITTRRYDKFIIGWQGAPQLLHQEDLDTITDELFVVLQRCPDAELLFYGQPDVPIGARRFGNRIHTVPWTTYIPEYYQSLTRMTVGVAPLSRSPFTDAKSNLRAVEYMTLGIPGLYADRPPYRDWVVHRDTGFIINSELDTKEWRRYLTYLYNDPSLVVRMSRNARLQALNWTTERNIYRWEEAYQSCRVPDTVPS